MQFFKLTDGIVELAKPEISLYPTIRAIISRDKGGKVAGDHDGRKKVYAFRELTYVYFMCDFNAYPIQHGLTAKEAHEYAVVNSQLESNYTPDDVIKLLMTQYSREHLSSAKQSARGLLRLFGMSNRIITSIENNLNSLLGQETLNKDQIAELLTYQKQMLDIAIALPANAKKLREAITLLEEEEKAGKILRGGDEMPSSMDPDNDVEK